jgi:asparagine synthetase B (glutamine-hydrolysing)
MHAAIKHRGPDGMGLWTSADGRVGMAHARLSIIDLATGDQPMLAPSGNAITYNGEIYNFIELREERGKDRFRTASDTEVILLAYEKWGERGARNALAVVREQGNLEEQAAHVERKFRELPARRRGCGVHGSFAGRGLPTAA